MLRDRVSSAFKEHRSRIEGALAVLLVLYWIFSYVYNSVVPVQMTILTLIVFLSLSIETLHPVVDEIRDEVRSHRISFRDRNDVNPYLHEVLNDESPDRVFFLYYNATSAKDVINQSISNDCEVFLLIKDPRDAINPLQRTAGQKRVRELFEENIGFRNVQIRFYDAPASLKMMKAGPDHVAVGWYTYDRRGGEKDDPIWGGENPMVAFSRDDDGDDFVVVDDWATTIYHRLWRDSVTLQDLYESDAWSEEGDLSELHRWVNEESSNPELVAEWIRATGSKSFASKEALFG